MFSWASISTPRSFSFGQISRYSAPRLYLCVELLWVRCRAQHWALLGVMWLVSVHQSNLSNADSPYPPSDNSPVQFAVLCKLPEGRLNPLVQIVDKNVKQNCPLHWTLGNTTGDWPPAGLNSMISNHSLWFTTALWDLPASQNFTQWTVHLSKLGAANFSTRMLWEMRWCQMLNWNLGR